MAPITKAQEELLRQLENGSRVRFVGGHYTVVNPDDTQQKIWPSTFYGLYDQKMVEITKSGYTVSEYGKEQIRSKKS